MATTPEVRAELLEASDEVIEDAVQFTSPMVLRGLLYQLTGDPEIAATQTKTVMDGFYEMALPATEEQEALIRRKAVEFLKRYRDSGAGAIDIGPLDRLATSLNLTAGTEISEADRGLWLEELALHPWARALEWQRTPPPERLEHFSVTVIGAGMGGLNAAVQLKRAGIPYRVIEKNGGVGGTWYENRYPGCRVDSPSRCYTHIYGVDFGYPNSFCPSAENEKYFNWIADTFGVRGDITFDTEVTSMAWDEASATWEISTEGPDGPGRHRANAVITSVGILSRPRMPDIEGMADFQGESFHSARWPEGLDVAGKRIAVIGSGCSGYQMTPELALEAEHVTVFQRTPSWLFPAPGYRTPLPPQVNWIERNFPYYANFMRFFVSHLGTSFQELATIDPDFHDEHTFSASNKRVRDECIAFLERKLGDPDLVAKMTPSHPPFSSRPVIIDPEYSILDALLLDNVTLVTDGIRRVNATGIETQDGAQHDFDIIVYATGFRAADFLFPMTVAGRGGTTVDEVWADGGARAYRGCMVPGFPNLWIVYGPNNNGSLQVAAVNELVTIYALECMERLILDGNRSIEVKEEAYRTFAARVDELNSTKAWSDPRARNWFTTKYGRSATQSPFTAAEAWRMLRHPDFADLDIS